LFIIGDYTMLRIPN